MSGPVVSVTMVEMQAPGTAQAMTLSPQARVIAGVLAIAFLLANRRLASRFSLCSGTDWSLAAFAVLAGAAFPGLVESFGEATGFRDPDVLLLSVALALWLSLALELNAIASRQAAQVARQARERRELQKLAARLLAGEPVGRLLAARLLDSGSHESTEDAEAPR